MSQEIERKFRVTSTAYRNGASGIRYRQNYLSNSESGVVRVRIAGEKGYLTIKGKNRGICRTEYEYEIPVVDAEEMLNNLCALPEIEKIRFRILFEGFVWEVDEFGGENEGLIIAEIELADENTEFKKPDWVGEDVSHDARYYNSNLLTNPYKNWSKI